MSYSAKSTGVPLNELVSITSQPTSRNPLCTFSTASGLVIRRFSLQPSKRRPPKSSRVRFWTCKLVPIAPSKTTMRSLSISRKLDISDFRLPIADLYHRVTILVQSEIGNQKSTMRRPRAVTTRGLIEPFAERLTDSPSCLADYFTWPQVALTHHVFAKPIETLPANSVKKRGYGTASGSDRTRDSTASLRSTSRKLSIAK